jgi:hypothetical protein
MPPSGQRRAASRTPRLPGNVRVGSSKLATTAGVEEDSRLLVGLVVDLRMGALRLTDSMPLIALALLS